MYKCPECGGELHRDSQGYYYCLSCDYAVEFDEDDGSEDFIEDEFGDSYK